MKLLRLIVTSVVNALRCGQFRLAWDVVRASLVLACRLTQLQIVAGVQTIRSFCVEWTAGVAYRRQLREDMASARRERNQTILGEEEKKDGNFRLSGAPFYGADSPRIHRGK